MGMAYLFFFFLFLLVVVFILFLHKIVFRREKEKKHGRAASRVHSSVKH